MHDPAPPDASDWHLREADDVARAHAVELHRGLHDAEVARRAELHGPNELVEAARRSPWKLLLEQFTDFMILVLIGAAILSGALGDLVDTLAILVIVVLNGLVGFVQAWRADRALAALKRLAAAHATVLRNGKVRRVSASALVPGDIVLIEAGNQIPADLRLTEVARLLVDESALTGESVSVEKHSRVLGAGAESLGDRLNMAYKGTTAAHGRGRGLVVATGMSTELGKVAGLMAAGGDRTTPLQRRLAAFGRRLAIAVLGICALIFAVGVLRGEPPVLMLLTAVSLAVAAIPEALPAVVTVLLALGARRMVSLNALVRRLPSVETLGSVTFICSDKTGTLTQNRMHVEEVVAAGEVWIAGRGGRPDPHCVELLRAGALCNDACSDGDGGWQGDPTEIALVEAASEADIGKGELDRLFPRVQELPFDSERKRMTTFHQTPNGLVAYTKGAPESLVPQCTTHWHPDGCGALDIAAALATAQAMATRGLRVLAMARRHYEQLPGSGALESVEERMQLLGLVGLIDPPREEAAIAVHDCISAGITPVMITGDHPSTAWAIARRLGIATSDESSGAEKVVITGAELGELGNDELRERVRTVRVYARVDPAQKIRIVEALQWHGEFVAMTGDGVNDAPALKRADIGVAMGRGGTDVAREASSLVLLDDNFATIVAAVREGRRIYDNIRKFVRYAMTGNSGEIWTIFLAPLFGLPIPLLPIHILWVNLVTDGLPGLALAAEPAERGIMHRPPRAPKESLFAHGMWQHILFVGLLIGALCLAVQAWTVATIPSSAQTMVFTTLTLAQMAHVLAIRSEGDSLWRLGLGTNRPLLAAVLLTFALQLATVYIPWLQPVFRTVPLNGVELGICFAAAVVVLLAVEAEKAWRRRGVQSPPSRG
ncbi:MAG TPA: cation-translocating P-type ATPase [Burkholderiaceae bacterium]|nr:cation-translocating P-type ATPase [Burkholderiaceae bacterium]